jgi:hypothetical protein
MAPLLALAAIVEFRLTKWHKFTPFVRWGGGLLACLVLMSLGSAAYTALSVLRNWNPEEPPSDFIRYFSYWSIYLGIAGVIGMPVGQLASVVLADIRLFPLAWSLYWGDRESARHERHLAGEIEQLRQLRRLCSEEVYKRVISHPDGVFVSTPNGGYKVHITDPYVQSMRSWTASLDSLIVERG